jgi:hypothetical protein
VYIVFVCGKTEGGVKRKAKEEEEVEDHKVANKKVDVNKGIVPVVNSLQGKGIVRKKEGASSVLQGLVKKK